MDRLNDSYTVRYEGEEITVYNEVDFATVYQVRGFNPTSEMFQEPTQIMIPGMNESPDYIAHWLADEIAALIGVSRADVERTFDVEIVDLESDDVEEL
jgi:hypothetical protein